jgi:hypothetical protein
MRDLSVRSSKLVGSCIVLTPLSVLEQTWQPVRLCLVLYVTEQTRTETCLSAITCSSLLCAGTWLTIFLIRRIFDGMRCCRNAARIWKKYICRKGMRVCGKWGRDPEPIC